MSPELAGMERLTKGLYAYADAYGKLLGATMAAADSLIVLPPEMAYLRDKALEVQRNLDKVLADLAGDVAA